MNRVCHMTSVHKRYDGRIFDKECRTLADLGYEVHLVVSDEEKDEKKSGVYIHSIGYKAKNRAERMTRASYKVYKLAKELDADVYHFHDPELMRFGLKLSKSGKKVIFDSHEHTIVQIYSKKYLVFPGAASKVFEKYQKKVVKEISAVITPTHQLVDMFKNDNPNSFLVTNYPKLEPLLESITKKRQICFTGGCDPQWKLEEIAAAVSETDCEFIIAGSGKQEYLNSVLQKGKGKVKYLGQLDKEAVYRLQAESIAGMAVNYGEQVIAEGGTLGNTKMFEYMMNRSSVICTDFPLWKEIIARGDCGLCVDANSVSQIRQAINVLLNDPNRCNEMSSNARRAVEREYNWETQIQNLKLAYDTVLENDKGDSVNEAGTVG